LFVGDAWTARGRGDVGNAGLDIMFRNAGLDMSWIVSRRLLERHDCWDVWFVCWGLGAFGVRLVCVYTLGLYGSSNLK